MKKSITKNYLYNLAYQLLVIIIPIITTPYISRRLGAENIGIYSFTLSIVTYFITFGSLGVALYGQREIAYLQDDVKKRSNTFGEIIIFRICTLTISMIVFYFIFVLKTNQYSIYYKVLLIEMIANMMDISWFFRGLEEFKKTVARNFIIKIITAVSLFVFVKTKNDLMAYFLIYVLSDIFGNFSLWLYLPKYIEKVNLKNINILKHLKPTIVLFIPQIAIQVYTLLDKTMIGVIIQNKSEVGYYEQSQKIIKILMTVITSLGTVMMPRIANTFAKGDKEKVLNYMKKSFSLVFLLAFPIIFGIISIANNFVPVFFGDGYDKVVILMQVISPIILLIGLSNVTGTQYLLPIKRQKEYTISVVCGAIINFIINSILISKLGALGASIGTVVAEFTVTAVQMTFVRKDFNLIEILGLSKNYCIASIIMFISCYLLNFIKMSNTINILLKVIVGGAVYILCLLVLKDKFLLELINKVLNKFRRK